MTMAKGKKEGDEPKTKVEREKVFIKRTELFDFQEAIKKMNGLHGSDLGCKRAKLRRQVDQEIEDIAEFTKTDEWKRVSKLYTDIDEKYAKKDASGTPQRGDRGGYIIPNSNMEDRNRDIAEMEAAEGDNIVQRKKIMQDYNESLDKKMEITHFTRIPNSLFPDNTPTEVKDWLWPIIDEDK